MLRRLWHTGYKINSNKSTLDLFIGLMVCPLDLFIYLPSQNNSKIDNLFGIRLKNRSNEDRAVKIHTYTHFGNGSARLTDGNTQSYLFKYNYPSQKQGWHATYLIVRIEEYLASSIWKTNIIESLIEGDNLQF